MISVLTGSYLRIWSKLWEEVWNFINIVCDAFPLGWSPKRDPTNTKIYQSDIQQYLFSSPSDNAECNQIFNKQIQFLPIPSSVSFFFLSLFFLCISWHLHQIVLIESRACLGHYLERPSPQKRKHKGAGPKLVNKQKQTSKQKRFNRKPSPVWEITWHLAPAQLTVSPKLSGLISQISKTILRKTRWKKLLGNAVYV